MRENSDIAKHRKETTKEKSGDSHRRHWVRAASSLCAQGWRGVLCSAALVALLVRRVGSAADDPLLLLLMVLGADGSAGMGLALLFL